MSHVRDPIESALADLVYLRARIGAIKAMAADPTSSGSYARECIADESDFLLAKVDQIRQTLDPESAK